MTRIQTILASLRFRNSIALTFCLILAGGTAQAGRPRLQVLDTDALLLPYVEQDALRQITTLRTASGEIVLADHGTSAPLRMTSLGTSIPCTSTWGSLAQDGTSNTLLFAEFVAFDPAFKGGVFVALSTKDGACVYSLGDLAAPGPLAPKALDSIAASPGFDPGSTRMGIIAVLIGLLVDPHVPAVFTVEGGQTVVRAWDGHAFRPVHLIEEEGIGIWAF